MATTPFYADGMDRDAIVHGWRSTNFSDGELQRVEYNAAIVGRVHASIPLQAAHRDFNESKQGTRLLREGKPAQYNNIAKPGLFHADAWVLVQATAQKAVR